MRRQSRVLRISVIGAGRVGSTLAFMLHHRGHKIVSVISRSPGSARKLGRLTRCRKVSTDLSGLERESDLLLIAVPDEAVEDVAVRLSTLDQLDQAHISVMHTSGSLTSDLLRPLAERGSRTFSMHPIQTFSKSLSVRQQVKMMRGIWYGCEGEKPALSFARTLVRGLGGKFLSVPKEQKILYHLACVFSSNYPIALLAAVEEIASRLQKRSVIPFSGLLSSSIQNALRKGAARALTGPVQRGSVNILELHQEELSRNVPSLLPLYRALGLYTLELARTSGSLTEAQLQQVVKVLAPHHDR